MDSLWLTLFSAFSYLSPCHTWSSATASNLLWCLPRQSFLFFPHPFPDTFWALCQHISDAHQRTDLFMGSTQQLARWLLGIGMKDFHVSDTSSIKWGAHKAFQIWPFQTEGGAWTLRNDLQVYTVNEQQRAESPLLLSSPIKLLVLLLTGRIAMNIGPQQPTENTLWAQH